MRPRSIATSIAALGLSASAFAEPASPRRWLAGDHHVHSIYSARYDESAAAPGVAPAPIVGGDSSHTIRRNAEMARRFGLDWMVATDHGGPRHSALNYAHAWPDVVAARRAVPGLLLLYGMEFDVPGGEHASLILPLDAGEREALRQIEAGYGKREVLPRDPARDTKDRMLAALRMMAALPSPPLLIANHPSRTATGPGAWGRHAPAEYRRWHAAAPLVAIGMEGAPGHQAARPRAGLDLAHGARGLYGGYPTMGGFDQMVATLGGGWDSLLGHGLHWTITANSDSHGHWTEGGADFWPGEYAKTWVYAAPTSADVLDGLRAGRVFVATGGLVKRLDVSVAGPRTPQRRATLGDTLRVHAGEALAVTIRFVPGGRAAIDHLDLIVGDAAGASGDRNPSARVVRRFTAADWQRDGDSLVVRHRLPAPAGAAYLRVRGSSSSEGEPAPDTLGEDPWQDLWFYANPIYLRG
jgi:hypothetical protein